ncbi:Clavaminate synthase-like protein [Saitoella complicata NRRL Y-17804]|uniref:Clavaminate synthase-like protein n=1 Tax=Saitoella complicata (strain BCRC 22490 / CBS 7301 / JCM 7358 / NBRC 10748 / NRRL Y-17804) TaxID=698492 RepID=UPI0008671F9A|nr:Clavaminate synthase-like protein [Saitoella complicata NRRL Y-17804]ODQ50825.1 Clavaminate synthase-like protein [Saitoella complicata NRRL Y-17804]
MPGILTTKDSIPPFPTDIPTIPLLLISYDLLTRPIGDPAGDEEKKRMFQACHELGFFYLKDLPVNSESMWDLADEFFGYSQEEKDKYDMGATGNYFGYKKSGAFVIDKKGTLDRTEFLNISKDQVLGVDPNPAPQPRVVTENPVVLKSFMTGCHNVVEAVLRTLSIHLGLNPEFLGNLHRIDRLGGDQARFTRAYPPPEGVSPMDPNTMAHTDYGSVTVLFNRLGGLQVLTPGNKEWLFVKPLPGTAIINLGDALVKMTGSVLRSNQHRVVTPPAAQAQCIRQSIVYFSRPDNDVRLAPIPSPLVTQEMKDASQNPEDYPTSGEWISNRVKSRLQVNYKGEESYTKGLKGTGSSEEVDW